MLVFASGCNVTTSKERPSVLREKRQASVVLVLDSISTIGNLFSKWTIHFKPTLDFGSSTEDVHS